MAKSREFKNIDGLSLFHEQETCYLNREGKTLGLEQCTIIELRNVDIRYSREMPPASLVNFRKPVTCYFNAADKFLFCGTYGKK